MPSNKNQHFVPRCHLKPFTKNQEDVTICLFNLRQQLCIEDVPVKHQCSKGYFYGKNPKLENAIQCMEVRYGQVAREVNSLGYRLSDDHRQELRLSWLFQYLRTEATSKISHQLTTESLTKSGADLSKVNLELKDAVQEAMGIFAESKDVMNDMKIVLLRNQTTVPFITSDNPAVLTNRWFTNRGSGRGLVFGLQSAGNLMLLPLSPDVLCCGYDGNAYQMHHIGGWIRLKSEESVKALNQHQFLNCNSNVYFNKKEYGQIVQDSYDHIAHLCLADKYSVQLMKFKSNDGANSTYIATDVKTALEGGGKHFVHSQIIRPKPTVWPSEIKYRAKPTCYTNGTGIGIIRRSAVQLYESRGITDFKKIKIPIYGV